MVAARLMPNLLDADTSVPVYGGMPRPPLPAEHGE